MPLASLEVLHRQQCTVQCSKNVFTVLQTVQIFLDFEVRYTTLKTASKKQAALLNLTGLEMRQPLLKCNATILSSFQGEGFV